MYSLAVINQKGGVGKTALTGNLGAALAELGHRVLLVDLDPQGHLTEACSLPEAEAPHTLAAVLLDRAPGGAAVKLAVPWRPGVDVIPTSLDTVLIERELYRVRAPEFRLRRVVDELAAADRWDVCLIDCPPSLGILTDNALVAAGHVLIPVQAEDSSLRALRLLLDQIRTAEAELRVPIEVVGMVANLVDTRRGLIITSTLDTLRQMPIDLLGVVTDRSDIRKAWRAGEPVIEYEPDSPAAHEIRALARRLAGGNA